MIRSLLIANRGEIACRVIRTAKRLGVRTVAVHSDADANAMHVTLADEAVRIGAAPAGESYLVKERIVAAALATGAEAIHPGYGFLSENAGFADAIAEAGLVFVGPPADAIRAMGSKSAAKALMQKAGVPLVPGYHGAKQDMATLQAAADRIGYPVLVKASAGGGGKGMRVVSKAADLAAAVEGAKREAKSSFGDPHLMLEKYLPKARHVEVQVFCDTLDGAVYLFERDCSVQRRHQKVFEEAPAPGMKPDLRARMGEAAVAAAKAVGYVGAGTVEFLLAGKEFYFIEMNTRLQVEHPVTEAITGTDLVEWQLRVASGEPLPMRQDELSIDGHAIEVRLYAEDPDKGFLPQTGTLRHLVFPEGPGVRIDTGVRQGDAVGVHYDPMIAKIIVRGADRAEACDRLSDALKATQVVGLETNLDLLLGVLDGGPFRKGGVDTGWLDRVKAPKGGWRRLRPADDETLAAAALAVVEARGRAACGRAARSGDRFSPWFHTDGWRLNGAGYQEVKFHDPAGDGDRVVHMHAKAGGGWRADIGDGGCDVSRTDGTGVLIDGRRRPVHAVLLGGNVTVFTPDGRLKLDLIDPAAETDDGDGSGGGLTAPMPGRVTAVFVKSGDKVKRGQPLLILEAMKMEHTIAAPAEGHVVEIRPAVGDQVEEGTTLVSFEAG